MTSVAPVLALMEASENALMDMMAQGGKATPRCTDAEAKLATGARAAEPALIGALSAESLDVADRMETLGELPFTRLAPIELVISPMGDDFHPFAAALARLQRLSAGTVGTAK